MRAIGWLLISIIFYFGMMHIYKKYVEQYEYAVESYAESVLERIFDDNISKD